jgi:hypothetical protein
MDLIIGALVAIIGILLGMNLSSLKREKRKPLPVVDDSAAYELALAIRDTVEYIGNDLLPAQVGWAWYDALRKYEPGIAQYFVDNPVRFTDKTSIFDDEKEDA